MITIAPGRRCGTVTPPASKSMAHRLMILAALNEAPVFLELDRISEDIEATARCLRALGAKVLERKNGLFVEPLSRTTLSAGAGEIPDGVPVLSCGESGSTLRFLLPLAAALGIPAVFRMEDRLALRPIEALIEALKKNGVQIEAHDGAFRLSGQLVPGDFELPGNISSQFVTGLLLALPLLPGDSTITIIGKMESEGYLRLTEQALTLAKIRYEYTPPARSRCMSYRIPGCQTAQLPTSVFVERDWSAAANFLVMGALSHEGIRVSGLDPESVQGDRRMLELLRDFGAEVLILPPEDPASGALPQILVKGSSLKGQTVDVQMIPDLVPILSVLAAAAEGETRISGGARLRFKETDRLRTTYELLKKLGADVRELEDGLLINGKGQLVGGSILRCHDHRIAMAAAAAALISRNAVTIPDSDCVNKSYPGFFEDFSRLEAES